MRTLRSNFNSRLRIATEKKDLKIRDIARGKHTSKKKVISTPVVTG
jgi:hypothetical protein